MRYLASTTEKYPAGAAGYGCTSCMPRMYTLSQPMSVQAMCGLWATASILLTQTGVSASVSLFALLIILGNLVLSGLLSLSGLTGLVFSLVGLIKGLAPRTMTGD